MPFGIQPLHIVIVAIVALLIFGPSRLPEIGRGIGKAITEFRRGAKEMSGSFMEEINQPVDPAKQPPSAAQTTAPGVPFGMSPPASTPEPSAPGVPFNMPSVSTADPAAQANFCIHCGKSNPVGAIFCNQCGQKVAE
jgi:TatA/E family protein of Tat protein translocase